MLFQEKTKIITMVMTKNANDEEETNVYMKEESNKTYPHFFFYNTWIYYIKIQGFILVAILKSNKYKNVLRSEYQGPTHKEIKKNK